MSCFEGLLLDTHNTHATLLSPWGCSGVDFCSGIKEGSVEIPSLFGFLMETAQEETVVDRWETLPRIFEGRV